MLKLLLIAAAAFLATVLLLAFWTSAQNPYADYPVVSQWVCALKGGAWYDGGILGPAGCYTT